MEQTVITVLLSIISYGTDIIWQTPDIFVCWESVAPGTIFIWELSQRGILSSASKQGSHLLSQVKLGIIVNKSFILFSILPWYIDILSACLFYISIKW